VAVEFADRVVHLIDGAVVEETRETLHRPDSAVFR